MGRRPIPFGFLTLLLAGSTAWGQTAITGTVTDKDGGGPLAGANVVISGGRLSMDTGAATDDEGRYRIPALRNGRYSIRVMFIGYATFEQAVQISATSGPEIVLDIELDAEAIQLQEYVVTASRGRREKLTDAIAAISVITASEIRRKSNPNLGDYFKNIKGIDFTASGIDGFNLSARGFNTSFSSRLMTLTDGRKANVPSLRLIAYNTIPTTSDDVDQIEVVLGPSSALYGPNAFAGVANILTKKPSLSTGTVATVSGGNRDYRKWQLRHAGTLGRLGYKVSLADFSAWEWEWVDPEEKKAHHAFFINGGDEEDLDRLYPWIWDGYDMRFDRNGNGNYYEPVDSVSYGIDTIDPDLNDDGLVDLPDFRVENQRVDIRIDYDLSSDHGMVYGYGWARATNINITGVARFLADRWIYQYHQLRYFKGNFFAQTYINTSDAGQTRNLRTGDVIVDKSKFYHLQAQHTLNFPSILDTRLTYGFDYQRTMPKTFGTILPDGKLGRSFDNDGIDNDGDGEIDELAEGLIVTNEYGIYFQSTSKLIANLQLVLASRLDLHSGVQDPQNGFKFIDDPLQGTTAMYKPQFSPKIGLMWKPSETQTIRLTAARAFNTPSSQALYLDLLVGQSVPFFIKARGNANGYHYSRRDGDLLMVDVRDGSDTYFFLAPIPAGAVIFIPAVLGRPSQFIDPANIKDLSPVESEALFTTEIGYIGLLGNRMRVTLDIYRSWYENFVSDLTWITPVVLDTSDGLSNANVLGIIGTEEHNGVDPGPDGIYGTADDLRDFNNLTQLLLTNVNYGEVSLGGVDFSLDYFFSGRLTAGLRVSYLGAQAFHNPLTNADDPINAPPYKISGNLNYQEPDGSLWAGLTVRHIPTFDWSAGVFFGTIRTYTVADLTLGYRLDEHYTVKVNISNLNNDVHREIVGGPEIGRMSLLTLTMSL